MVCSTSKNYFISVISFAALSTPNDSQDYYKVPFFPLTVHSRHCHYSCFLRGIKPMIISWYPKYLWYSLAPTLYLSSALHNVDTSEILNQKEKRVICKLTKEQIPCTAFIETVPFFVYLQEPNKFKCMSMCTFLLVCIRFASHSVPLDTGVIHFPDQ